jgi:ABC-type nitrate/sulfonate/bicarbonate transport system ATPase subunit
MSDRPLIAAGLSRSFGNVEVLRDIDLEIGREEFVAIVGPSGCGKTTLLNLLSGHDAPSSGTVMRLGQTRMVYQHGGLFPWLTVAENVQMGLRHVASAAERVRAVADLLAFIRLEAFAEHYPRQLSGGMRQRVELARSLAGETDILLMDEPFSALDYFTRLRMRDELARMLRERPQTVVFVTHDVIEAAQLADRVVVLSGRPARIRFQLEIDLPRPRALTDSQVVDAVREVLRELDLESDSNDASELMEAAAGIDAEE